jgi:hypothetical protein
VQNKDKGPRTLRIDTFYQPLFALDEALEIMVAEDGMSFRQVSNSRALAQYFSLAGYINQPRNHTAARNKVMKFKKQIKDKFASEIKEIKLNSKFSIILDEWTSSAFRKYLSVILVKKDKLWNLGMERLVDSATSLNLKTLLE